MCCASKKRRQDEMKLAVGPAWDNSENLVFTNEMGAHLKHDLIYRHLKRVFAQMGVPKLRFHDLRHSYAVLSIQAGDDIKTVQENLGHYSAAFTLDVYGHVTDRMRRDSSERMDRYIHTLKAAR
jgi:integrase